MFAVEPKPEGAPGPSKKWVIDHERSVSLQVIVGLGRSDGQAFILIHDAITIPFNVMFDPGHVDPASGDPYYIMRFSSFGRSGETHRLGYSTYEFADETEERHWKRIAAEALLIYGPSYLGMTFKDGYARVELDGEFLKRSDFGYSLEPQG